MKTSRRQANRSTVVVGGGIAGFAVGGPVGAVAGGVSAGGAADGLQTAYASYDKGEYTPTGTVGYF